MAKLTNSERMTLHGSLMTFAALTSNAAASNGHYGAAILTAFIAAASAAPTIHYYTQFQKELHRKDSGAEDKKEPEINPPG